MQVSRKRAGDAGMIHQSLSSMEARGQALPFIS